MVRIFLFKFLSLKIKYIFCFRVILFQVTKIFSWIYNPIQINVLLNFFVLYPWTRVDQEFVGFKKRGGRWSNILLERMLNNKIKKRGTKDFFCLFSFSPILPKNFFFWKKLGRQILQDNFFEKIIQCQKQLHS